MQLETSLRITSYALNGYIKAGINALTFVVVASHTADTVGMQLETSLLLILYASNGYIKASFLL